MSQAGSGGFPYQVEISDAVADALRQLFLRAVLAGQGPAAASAFWEIVEALHRQPNEFGEPLYPLIHLHLQMRRAAIRPLVVTYGVHEQLRIVFVQSFHLLSAWNSPTP